MHSFGILSPQAAGEEQAEEGVVAAEAAEDDEPEWPMIENGPVGDKFVESSVSKMCIVYKNL